MWFALAVFSSRPMNDGTAVRKPRRYPFPQTHASEDGDKGPLYHYGALLPY